METTGTKVSLEDLQGIVGHAREATTEDAVDGVAPSFVVEPGSTAEISELMKLASREGLRVAPRGGGTKMYLGNPPTGLDLIVSTVRMNEVVEHVPGDQVVKVQAGIRLEDLQRRMSEANQMLGTDPSEKVGGATVGGVVAANSTGPRRYRYGTIRDLIIGITIVLSDGTVAKAGGKVVKNVAGYDLSKLFTGSLGTLGIIADATFRLHPVPETASTVVVDLGNTVAAREAAQSVVHSQVVASAAELDWRGEEGTFAVLIENIEPAVQAQVETVEYLLQSHGEPRVLRGEEATEPIDSIRRTREEAGVRLKIGFEPAGLTDVLDGTLGAAGRREITARITGHAASGVTYAGLSGGDEEAQAAIIEELRQIIVPRGGSVVVQKAPTSLKKRVEVWGPARDKLAINRRVKEKFDPPGILNPGRFIGGI
jgi:glycolate dehydrogenase FAD-binding subunit